MASIDLQWKAFSVNLDKINFTLKANLSSNYDGLVAEPEILKVMFKQEAEQPDIDYITTYWENITSTTFNKTLQEIIQTKIDGAVTFGNKLILDAVISNVSLGITQAGKTRAVSDYLRALQRYLREGSLYAAMEEIDELISLGIPAELSPFVTSEKLTATKIKIQAYVAI